MIEHDDPHLDDRGLCICICSNCIDPIYGICICKDDCLSGGCDGSHVPLLGQDSWSKEKE